MLKRILKINLIVLLACIVLFGCARFLDKSIGGIYDDKREPYLQSASKTSIIIRWQTKRRNIGVVRIGKALHDVEKIFSESVEDDEHQLQLTGLTPNTRYYYSVGTSKYSFYSGKEYWFKTSPNKTESPIRFWVTGDQGQAGEIQNNVRDSMLSWTKKNTLKSNKKGIKSNLDFWLTTGDNAYRSGTNHQFQSNFFSPYKSILKHTPVWPAYGNHDARRWTFFNVFSLPTKAEVGGVASETENYYSFNYGNLHVVMLDSVSSRIQKNSKMLRWLKKDLKAATQKWLVAVLHHPPYTKGTHDSDNIADSGGRMRNVRRFVLPLLEEAGVDVVLSGHSHMYERSWFMRKHYGKSNTFNDGFIVENKMVDAQNGYHYSKSQAAEKDLSGTIYVTIGSSARLDRGDLNHVAMPVSLHESGSMIFDINENKLTANFINQTGLVADSFSITKTETKASE